MSVLSHKDFLSLSGKHILYFGDPMCSWCWGFSPVFKDLLNLTTSDTHVHVIVTGLRAGTRTPWDDELRTYIRHHWQSVQDRTGQPFDFSRFDNENFVYDTEPLCRAVVAARTLDNSTSLAFFDHLQDSFYAQGEPTSELSILFRIAQSVGLCVPSFENIFLQSRTSEQTRSDFKLTRDFGITGYPSVLLLDNGEVKVLTQGYQTFDSLAPALQEWLNA